jgi:hypothetical protein
VTSLETRHTKRIDLATILGWSATVGSGLGRRILGHQYETAGHEMFKQPLRGDPRHHRIMVAGEGSVISPPWPSCRPWFAGLGSGSALMTSERIRKAAIPARMLGRDEMAAGWRGLTRLDPCWRGLLGERGMWSQTPWSWDVPTSPESGISHQQGTEAKVNANGHANGNETMASSQGTQRRILDLAGGGEIPQDVGQDCIGAPIVTRQDGQNRLARQTDGKDEKTLETL